MNPAPRGERGGDLSEKARRFVAEAFASVEDVEILLFLRQKPTEALSASTVARRLSLAPDLASERMRGLHALGLLAARDEGVRFYRYAPTRPGAEPAMDEVAEVYARRPAAVLSVLVAARSRSVRAFSDAFRLRKDEGET
jgi:hypothetical protein